MNKRNKGKTSNQLENELAELLESEVEPEAGRYMLVDNWTGEDMRPAHDFEVEQIQRTPHGIAMLELGGRHGEHARQALRGTATRHQGPKGEDGSNTGQAGS